MRIRCSATMLLAVCCAALHARPAALFYMTDDPNSIRSFLAHESKIDLLVPTWYSVDENGLLTGTPNPTVLDAAQRDGLPVMPIVLLFGKKKFHDFSGNAAARSRMNDALLREAKLHGYAGFQFDFENLDYLDRDALTAVIAESAGALHGANLKISIATIPNAPGYPGKGSFSKWIYTEWRGAYDIAALAKSVDLLCLMTYDQQTQWTMPGPVAGWQWVNDNLDYALKVVPREKLSMGIPLYGYHWYASAPIADKATGEEKPKLSGDYIGTPDALQLAKAYGAKLDWDEGDHSAYFYFYRDQLREWIFYTDVRTFRDRYKLAEDRQLEGFCSWVLGMEDPEIWSMLPDRKVQR